MARKFQNIAFGYAIPSYFHNIESTLHIYVHVYYITICLNSMNGGMTVGMISKSSALGGYTDAK